MAFTEFTCCSGDRDWILPLRLSPPGCRPTWPASVSWDFETPYYNSENVSHHDALLCKSSRTWKKWQR